LPAPSSQGVDLVAEDKALVVDLVDRRVPFAEEGLGVRVERPELLGGERCALAQRMGHAEPALRLRVYGHLFEGVQEALTERLEERRKRVLPQADDVVSLRPAIRSSGPEQDHRTRTGPQNMAHPKIWPFQAIGGQPRTPRKKPLTWENGP